MKRLFVCAAALGLFVSLPTSAQNNDRHGDRNDAATSHADRGSQPAGGNHNGQGRVNTGDTHAKTNDANRTVNRANTPQTMNRGFTAGPSHTQAFTTHNGQPATTTTANRYLPNTGDVHPNQQGRSMTSGTQNYGGRSGIAASRQPAVNSMQRNAMGPANNGAQRTNVNALRQNMQASRHFRSVGYNAPQGYQSRHWSYGERLPRGYFVRDYWIADFMMFDLFAPPPGLIWVRVGDDALLIDQYSGDIVQVRYGVFY